MQAAANGGLGQGGSDRHLVDEWRQDSRREAQDSEATAAKGRGIFKGKQVDIGTVYEGKRQLDKSCSASGARSPLWRRIGFSPHQYAGGSGFVPPNPGVMPSVVRELLAVVAPHWVSPHQYAGGSGFVPPNPGVMPSVVRKTLESFRKFS
jgi:hypothetical protein